MAILLFYLLLLSLLTGDSNSTYCECKDGVSAQNLQKTLDYACGAGADCSQTLKNGGCYEPNTVKDHCNYAVNSYFQLKAQAPGSCDFAGTASATQTLPPSMASGCVYPSGSTPSGGTSTMNPTTNPSSPTPPSTPPPSTTFTTPTTIPSVFGSGISPTSTGTGTGTSTIYNDTSAASSLVLSRNFFNSIAPASIGFTIVIISSRFS